MIAFLNGILDQKHPTSVVLDVQGVGYAVLIPLGTYDRLPAIGERCRLLVHHHIREDGQLLCGFATEEERRMFELLIGISGIGPKLALGVLSGLSVAELRAAIAEGNCKRLSGVRGVGKKTAERIVVELRDKVGAAGAWEAASAKHSLSPDDQKLNDAVLALMALGFKQIEAHDAVRAAQAMLGVKATVEDLVRACLKKG